MIKTAARFVPVVLAIMILGLVLIPARVWHHPAIDATYRGFDSNLVFSSASGPAIRRGLIDIAPTSITIQALPGSHPTIHMLTTPLAFSADFDAVVNAADPRTVPLRVGIWSPATGAGYFLVFDAAAGNEIREETIVGGTPGVDLVGGTVSANTLIGQFEPGELYHVTLELDRVHRTITTHLFNRGAPPAGAHVVRVGNALGAVSEVDGSPIAVTPGHSYSFGGWVDPVAATSTYAIGILWFDQAGKRLPIDTDHFWRQPGDHVGWMRQTSDVIAPPGAAAARIFLGAGPASSYLFGGLFFTESLTPGVNLLPNGSFDLGMSGWRSVQGGSLTAAVVEQKSIDFHSTVTARDAPKVFDAFRPTLTVSASSEAGMSDATVTNYVLTLPSQPSSAALETEKIDDPLARILVLLALVTAVLACVAASVRFALHWVQRRRARGSRSAAPNKSSSRTSTALWIAGGFLCYLVLNMLLFPLGSLHFDVLAAKVWSYVAVQGGIADLYYRPLTVTTAAAWNGVPVHEAVFSYGITKAYYYLLVGWSYRLLLSPAGQLNIDTYSLEVLLKSLNVAFAFVDGLLVYFIVKRFTGRRSAIASAILLGLNPALVFAMSVWGSTEAVSLFFVFASIWLAEKNRPLLAWLMLSAGAYTRPQMFVFAFLLGTVYVRKFRINQNLSALAWTVIVSFVFLGPFVLTISPSVPVDFVTRTLSYHLANGQADPNYLGLSPGYYSVWTLPLEFVNGQHGLARMWSSSNQMIFGSVTYGTIAATLSIALVLAVGSVILLARSSLARSSQYLPLVAFGVLGWLMLTPGLISRYFIYAIATLILCRAAFSIAIYLWIVGPLTAITLVTTYGHIALDFLGYGTTSSPLSPLNNVISRSVFDLFSDDRFITAGTVVNIAILVMVGARAFQTLLPTGTPNVGTRVEATSRVASPG